MPSQDRSASPLYRRQNKAAALRLHQRRRSHLQMQRRSAHSQAHGLRIASKPIGVLGANLIYGAFYLNDSPKDLLQSFYDNIEKDTIEIDMVDFSGPRFMYVDNRFQIYTRTSGHPEFNHFFPVTHLPPCRLCRHLGRDPQSHR